jgi:hypothetical protein
MARFAEAPSFELGTRYGLLLHLVFTALLLRERERERELQLRVKR